MDVTKPSGFVGWERVLQDLWQRLRDMGNRRWVSTFDQPCPTVDARSVSRDSLGRTVGGRVVLVRPDDRVVQAQLGMWRQPCGAQMSGDTCRGWGQGSLRYSSFQTLIPWSWPRRSSTSRSKSTEGGSGVAVFDGIHDYIPRAVGAGNVPQHSSSHGTVGVVVKKIPPGSC
jgi:hypothetical protein